MACFRVYSIIEMALRIRLGKPEDSRSSLRTMFEDALANNFFTEEWLPKGISYLRNLIAHGRPMNGSWSATMLLRSGEIINR